MSELANPNDPPMDQCPNCGREIQTMEVAGETQKLPCPCHYLNAFTPPETHVPTQGA